MADPYYNNTYGGGSNYQQGGYRNNSYGNNQGSGGRYNQYSQGNNRRGSRYYHSDYHDDGNRSWNSQHQWQSSSNYQHGSGGGYYQSNYNRHHNDNRHHHRQGSGDNRSYRANDNRDHHHGDQGREYRDSPSRDFSNNRRDHHNSSRGGNYFDNEGAVSYGSSQGSSSHGSSSHRPLHSSGSHHRSRDSDRHRSSPLPERPSVVQSPLTAEPVPQLNTPPPVESTKEPPGMAMDATSYAEIGSVPEVEKWNDPAPISTDVSQNEGQEAEERPELMDIDAQDEGEPKPQDEEGDMAEPQQDEVGSEVEDISDDNQQDDQENNGEGEEESEQEDATAHTENVEEKGYNKEEEPENLDQDEMENSEDETENHDGKKSENEEEEEENFQGDEGENEREEDFENQQKTENSDEKEAENQVEEDEKEEERESQGEEEGENEQSEEHQEDTEKNQEQTSAESSETHEDCGVQAIVGDEYNDISIAESASREPVDDGEEDDANATVADDLLQEALNQSGIESGVDENEDNNQDNRDYTEPGKESKELDEEAEEAKQDAEEAQEDVEEANQDVEEARQDVEEAEQDEESGQKLDKNQEIDAGDTQKKDGDISEHTQKAGSNELKQLDTSETEKDKIEHAIEHQPEEANKDENDTNEGDGKNVRGDKEETQKGEGGPSADGENETEKEKEAEPQKETSEPVDQETADVEVTGQENIRSRRSHRDAAFTPVSSERVVIGTVETVDSDNSGENGDYPQDGVTIKQENDTGAPVTKWIVGADGELVRADASGAPMPEPQAVMSAPWTQMAFGAQTGDHMAGPQQSGFLIQIEDLRVSSEESHEDVSDFLHIPQAAVDLWRSTKKCPVTQCKGPALTLKHFFDWHWYVFHEQLIKVYYCPVSGCKRMSERWNTRRKRDLIAHLTQKHCVEQFPEAIETQIISNPNYKPPTNFVDAPAQPAPSKAKTKATIVARAAEAKRAGKATTSPAKKKSTVANDMLNALQGVQAVAIDDGIPAEIEEAWKNIKMCPCTGCGKERITAISEYKRHWAARHAKSRAMYICPDSECGKGKGRSRGPYNSRDVSSMIRHLVSPAHLLNQSEANQIATAIMPVPKDNVNYIEPIISQAKMSPEAQKINTPKKPKATPVRAEPEVSVDAPRSSRRSRAEPEPDSTPTPARSRAGRSIKGRVSDFTNMANDTPTSSDSESVSESRKRRRGADPTPDPPAKRSRPEPPAQPTTPASLKKVKFMTLGELDQFEEAKEEIIPREFLEWWVDRNGCPSTTCSASVCHFRIHDLIRHWKLRHMSQVPLYYCPTAPACDYTTKTKSTLKKHLSNKHSTRPSALDSIISKSKASLVDNLDYEPPVHPNPKAKSGTPKSRAKSRSAAFEEAETSSTDTQSLVEVMPSRSRSGKPIHTPPPKPGPKSAQGRGRSTRSNPVVETSPLSGVRLPSEVVINLPQVDEAPSTRSGRRTSAMGPKSMAVKRKSLEQSDWQPTVDLASLPERVLDVGWVDTHSRLGREIIDGKPKKQPKMSSPPPPKKSAPAPTKTPGRPSTRSTPRVEMPDVRFEADDDDDDNDSGNFGVQIPMPSMEDAGIAVSFGSRKSPKSAASPGSKRVGPMSVRDDDEVDDYRAALRSLQERQRELEKRLAGGSGTEGNADVVKKITELQAQNEALRYQNEALRNQLKSGRMAKEWEEEKAALQQQLNAKDVTIGTLQDVISRLGNGSTTSNVVTNQMIALPRQMGGRSTRSGAAGVGSGGRQPLPAVAAAPPQRMSITPRAGTSNDGTQQCSVALKSGAKVNFEYNSFEDFMQKIGTLNDQYGLNE